ncbi:MAG: hypothetical protein IPK65_01070 [Gammaproteobacteria bacterium]|nr:hypothetical protein [Gammaproteobacteria bacterium]
MKKKLIAIAVAGAVMGSTAAMAEDMNSHVNVEGWADVIWKLAGETDIGGTSTDDLDEGQFSVPSAEVNFSTDYLVVDSHASDLDDLSLGS